MLQRVGIRYKRVFVLLATPCKGSVSFTRASRPTTLVTNMKHFQLLLWSFLVGGAFAGTKTDSNMYMDTLLSMIVPDKARSLGLDLVAVPNFRFKVKSTAVTNKDMKAEFHSGKLLGVVSPGLIRRGDCSAPGWLGSNITIGCYLSLDALHLSYLGSAKGDSLFNTNKSITLDVVPTNANAFIETTSTLGELCGIQ